MKKKKHRTKGRRPQAAAVEAAARGKIVRTPDGTLQRRLPNGGHRNNCGPMALLQLLMRVHGVPVPDIVEATTGELEPNVQEALQLIREITVEHSNGHYCSEGLSDDPGDETLTFGQLVESASGVILSKAIWKRVMGCLYGYFDGRAVMVGGDALGLKGLVVVKLDDDGFLVAVDGTTTPLGDAEHLIFWDGHAHFEALVPLEDAPVSPGDSKWGCTCFTNACLSTSHHFSPQRMTYPRSAFFLPPNRSAPTYTRRPWSPSPPRSSLSMTYHQ